MTVNFGDVKELSDSALRYHVEANAATSTGWERFATHRARVHRMLERAPPGALCVLGAGNCNDVDLAALLARFDRVTLVDLDRDAVEAGVRRQLGADLDRVEIVAPHDVTGALPALATVCRAAPRERARLLSPVARVIAAPPPWREGEFSAVLSACVLSQLNALPISTWPDPCAELAEILGALRVGHLSTMLSLLADGGIACIAHDMVSSDTAPALRTVPPNEVSELARRLIRANNFVHGGNPHLLEFAVREPALAPRIAQTRAVTPWVWRIGVDRFFLVNGLVLTRAPRASASDR